ncbi:MAG TPA: RidA family protein [Gemmatimonadales bacterium]|jgi:enamine deaminase RidA (YjgF/YER057c/UK114 family)|nr:RidA family protein [Gemmatimonadales bacterium]
MGIGDGSFRRATLIVAAASLGCAPVMGSGGGGPGEGPRGMRGGGFDPTDTRYVNPGTLAALDGFTHAVRVGQTVYVSGEVALDSMGRLVGPGDLAAQARQAFANLELVLHIAGAVPAEVVRLDVYVVGYKPGDVAVIREAGAKFFPARNPPAGIVLGVAALPRDGLLIAVDATAVIKAMFRPIREDRVPRDD